MYTLKIKDTVEYYSTFLKTNPREKILKIAYNLTTSKKKLLKHQYLCGFSGCNTPLKTRLQPTYNRLQPRKHLQPLFICNVLKLKSFALGCRL